MGIGDGTGKRFVRGSYDTIKLLQTKLDRLAEFEKQERCIELPVEERKEHLEILKYKGWSNIEQLEDVIGEEPSCRMYFEHMDDFSVNYDLELRLRRIKRSEKQE